MLRMLLHLFPHQRHRSSTKAGGMAGPIFLFLLVLLVVDNKCMDEEDGNDGGGRRESSRPWKDANGNRDLDADDYYEDDPSSSSSFSSSVNSRNSELKTFSNTLPIIELVGPKKYVALGGNDLIILYRLSPSSSLIATNTLTTLSSSLSLSSSLRSQTPANANNGSTANMSHHPNTYSYKARPATASLPPGPITGGSGKRKLIMYLTLEDETLTSSTPLPSVESKGIDDESETLITKQVLTKPPIIAWQEVHFDCGWIVQGASYKVTLMEELVDQQHGDYWQQPQNFSRTTRFFISSLIIHTDYPSIDFEVPHRLESYTASVPISIGLTRSLCKPKLPLPPTQLTLNLCKAEESDLDSGHAGDMDELIQVQDVDDKHIAINAGTNHHSDCGRIFAVLATNPLDQLEKEGQITMTIGCNLWGRSGYFRVQLERYFGTQHTDNSHNRTWIARSEPIKVDWSSRFRIEFTKNRKSIIPCPETEVVGLEIDYPSCVINGLDKIRVYGYETLPLPSILAPKRLSYIREELIPSNTHHLSFSCSLFPQRFSRYCFQYINTAVDGSVALVVENCIPTFPPDQFSDGGWGPWSPWSPCSTSCGKDGRRFRYRFCDSPLPSFGANYCQGDSIEESECGLLPECFPAKRKPISSFDLASMYEDEEYSEGSDASDDGDARRGITSANASQPFLHINNLNHTFGCECGCLLHDLVPGFNYSLIVTLSPAQSYCEDEDEEEHHNLKWILHAKGAGNRIRFLIVGVDLQCMTLSFRDGNTTDSNLLEVMTMSTQYSLLQPSTPKQEETSASSSSSPATDTDGHEPAGVSSVGSPKEKEKKEESRRLKRLLHIIESTGASLSIATSESSQNCSTTPTVYFVAYYHIVPVSPPASRPSTHSSAAAAAGIAERHSKPEWNMYEFWSFLFIKFVLTFFVIIILFTTFGGFATKIYRRAKYKKLTWIVTDDDKLNTSESESGNESENDDEEKRYRSRQQDERWHNSGEGDEYDQLMSNGSRNTSVTLMSFDQSYWKQIRTLRLKHFLLNAPRRKHVLTKVSSYPSTPVHGQQIKLAFRTTNQAAVIAVDEANGGEPFDETMIQRYHNAGTSSNDSYEDRSGACDGQSGSKRANNEGNESKSYDWRHKKELNKLTSLSDSNLKNMKRVNLQDIICNGEDDDVEDELLEFERRNRIVECYRSRKNTGSSTRPSSIIIVRSKSSNVPIMPHALSALPSTKNYAAWSMSNGNGLCDGTCGGGDDVGGGGRDRMRNNKCNCSCTTRNINDINTRASTKKAKTTADEEEEFRETKGKRGTMLAIMKRTVRSRASENEKIRKEKENLKRRGIEMSQIMSKEQCAYTARMQRKDDEIGESRESGRRRVAEREELGYQFNGGSGCVFDSRSCTPATTTRTASSASGGTCSIIGKSRKNKRRTAARGGGFDSQSSIPYSIKNSSGYLYNKHGDSRDTDLNDVDDEEDDEEQDFEMDYYDYDASNAANIPGSLFGMEPAFVLWNSEMYSAEDEHEGDPLTMSQTTDELLRTISSTTNTNYDNDGGGGGGGLDMMTDNGEEDEEMLELITTTTTTDSNMSSSSTAPVPGIKKTMYFKRKSPSIELVELQQNKQQGERPQPQQSRMPKTREISLDTLKFVDEVEFDEEV